MIFHPRSLWLGSLIMFALVSHAFGQNNDWPGPSVSVVGTGKQQAPPDTAHIHVGVVTESETAQAAVQLNNQAMTQLLAVLEEQGVPKRNVQTSNFNVSPQYRHDPRDQGRRPPQIVGYQVSNMVRIKTQDLAKLGAVLDAVVRAGANQIHGISFSVDDDQRFMEAARRLAVDDARRKAQVIAEQAGARLGKVFEIREATMGPPQPMMAQRFAVMADAAQVPIETGEQTLTVQLSVTYELVQE